MTDHSLSMAALRVAVNAARDSEMRAMSEALAASRARHLDVLNRFTMSEERVELEEVRRSVAYATLADQNEQLRRELTKLRGEIAWYSWVDLPRERLLREAGARTARWVQRCVAGNVPMSAELRDDIARVLEDDEAEGDTEPMLQDDDAELGEDRHGGGMARLTSQNEELRAALAEARRTNTDLEQRLEIADVLRVERQSFRADREHDLALGGARLLQWARGHFELLPMEIAYAGWVMQQPAGTFAFVEMEVAAATVP